MTHHAALNIQQALCCGFPQYRACLVCYVIWYSERLPVRLDQVVAFGITEDGIVRHVIPKYFLNGVTVFNGIYFFLIVIILSPESSPTVIPSALLVYPSGRFRISTFRS